MIEGYDLEPLVLEPWQPPYYRELLEGLGMTKTMDMWMWRLAMGELKQGDQFHDFIHKSAQESVTEHGVVVRHMRKRDLEAEVTRFMDVYNEAWGENWGFVPITEEEVRFQAKNLKPILDENWAMIAERDGEVVGAALSLPDINQVLAKMNGRLLPFGWLRFLTGRAKIDRIRVFALGVKPRYQHLGVAAALYVRHIEVAARVRQKWGEMGWILEVNEPMNRAMEGMGGTVTKRYRLYELPLSERLGWSVANCAIRGRLTAEAGYRLPSMQEEVVLEAQAVEEPAADDGEELEEPSRLPEPSRRTEVEAWRGEVRTAAIAAAGGLVAGAATVAAVRAVRSSGVPRRQRQRRLLRRRQEPPSIIASRSFMVDVHILGRPLSPCPGARRRRPPAPASRSRCARRGRTACPGAAGATP